MPRFRRNKIVDRVLERYPRARQDDKFLTLAVWQEEGLVLTTEQMRIFLSKKVAPIESITRARRQLQAKGLYLPPQAVIDARKELEDETRHDNG